MALSPEQKTALEIQRGILQSEDDIVRAIQKALGEIDPKDPEQKKIIKKTKYSNLEESQFRNLVRVADSTESSEAIKNFLRYQTGRDNKWGKGKDSLAEQIIQDINGLLDELANNIATNANTSNNKPIHIKLIRLYLGYGARHLKYLNSLS